MKKVAFVTPWYGAKIPGGMEAETRRTAQQLAAAGFAVEVLTTCIRDFYADWGKNYHRAKVTQEQGVTVRRFKVKKRDKGAFDAVNAELMRGGMVGAAAEKTYISQMINCPTLYAHIAQHQQETVYIFIPYMFATTYYGAQICPAQSIVIPCLHDEAYARMDIYREVLPHVHTLILHTHAEHGLTQRLFGEAAQQQRRVIGEGVDTAFKYDGGRFRRKYGIDRPFVLYAGRREPGKNTPLLLREWATYVRTSGTNAELILIGAGEVGERPPQTRDLGFVPKQDMYDAMAAADVFCLPSVNESFSLVLMESWLTKTPVLVHGDCAVTVEHCRRSNGGLYFRDSAEFTATLTYLFEHKTMAKRMGQMGRKYVLENFQWDSIIDRYKKILAMFGVKKIERG